MGPKHRYIARVEVHFTDGTMRESRVEAQRGSEQCFASEADVVAKYRKLASRVFDSAQVERLRDSIQRLEQVDEVAELGRLLHLDQPQTENANTAAAAE